MEMGPTERGGAWRTRLRPRPSSSSSSIPSIQPPLAHRYQASNGAEGGGPMIGSGAGLGAGAIHAAGPTAACGSDRLLRVSSSSRLRTRIRPATAPPRQPQDPGDEEARPFSRGMGLRPRPRPGAFGGLLALASFLLATVVLSPVQPAAAQAMWSMGSDDVSGSRAPVENLGKTEGCFSKFEPLLSKVYNPVELDNRVCQAWCASQRMSVSATSLSTCYCGNIYPSAYFRVKDDFCDNPCSPDKQYCFVNACCGSRDGRYFTVAFAGQLDPVLQLLRQLTYDYRTNNPKLRAHIKELMGASAPLQVMSSQGGYRTGVVMSGGAGVGLQGSCPEHYTEFQGTCFSRVFGDMMSFAQAEARCAQDGAVLATVQSPAENAYVASMLYQRSGWIGLSNRDVGRFQWDDWTNWGPGEPTANGAFLTTLGPAGTASGEAFDDKNINVRNIRQLAVYASSRLLGVQAKYLLRNGSEVVGNVMGTNKGGNTAVISLTYGQHVSGAFGELVNGVVQSLGVVVKDVKGNTFTYGPYGTTGASGAKPWSLTATSLITGFFGTASAQGINSLGFHELQTPRCTQVTPGGTWRAVPCQQAFDGVSYACQLRPTASAVDCPSGGWFRYGALCYKAFSGNKLSWEAARQSCLTMQATLVTVTTPEMNAFLQSRFQGAFGFIGLKDRVPVGQTNRSFVWETYNNWAPGQPAPPLSSRTSSAFGGGCVAMDANQLWFVIDCDDTSGARATVCELAPADKDNSCTCPGGWTPFGCRCYRVVVPDAGGGSGSGQTGMFGAGVSWLTASAACAQLGGALLDVNSPGEASYVATRLAKGQGVFLGQRDVFNAGVYSADTYTNWAAGEPIDNLGTVNGGGGGLCGVLRGDGQWYGFPCTSSFNQAVCKRPKAAPVGGVEGRGEEFTMLALDPAAEPRWGQPLDVYLKHTATGAYLGVDSAGNLFTSTAASPDAQLTVMSVANTTGFTIRSRLYDFYLRLDPDEGRLATVDSYGDTLRYLSAEGVWVREPAAGVEESGPEEPEPQQEEQQQEEDVGVFGKRSQRRRRRQQSRPAAGPPTRAPTAAPTPAPIGPSIFTSMQSFGPISLQNLQIGLAVQRSDSMPHPRYCSLKVYDLTATSDSFSCFYIEGDASGLPMVELEVDAFTIQDKTTILNPRTPLQNGRTRCENESPTDTLTCTFAYGEGLTFSKALAVQFGHNYANQFQLEHQSTDYSSVWYNWLSAFDNQYISITTNTYVESRNWAVNVPVPPLTVCTMQFWLSSVALDYVWQAILKATGGFDLSAHGVYFGSNYALSDISNPWDLRVYQWGRYSAPTQAEVIITTDELQNSKYNLQPPSMSNV